MNTILFDFDGTLMDTWPGIEATLKASLKDLKIPVRDDSITRALVGIPLHKVFEQLLEGEAEYARLATVKYRELFPVVGMPSARPFEGAVGMLEELLAMERALFLVTARNEEITRQMMENHGLAGFFTWVRGEREGEVPDGKAHMVAEVLMKYSLNPAKCLMVGDRRYDVEAARANGLQAVGVTYGYGTEEELVDAGARDLAGSIGELEEILLNSD